MIINWNILKKSVFGTLSPLERQMLEQWLKESESHQHFHETIREYYGTSPEKLELSDEEVNAAWQRFSVHVRSRSNRWRKVWTAAAASLAAAVILGIWTLNPFVMPAPEKDQGTLITAGSTQAILCVGETKILLGDSEQDSEWRKLVTEARSAGSSEGHSAPPACEQIRIEVPKGGEYRLRLPDSTMVWLNSETVIEYPSEFSADCRTIALSGEAFFNVAHNPARPFSITTPDQLKIRVLGTRFNISSYMDVDHAQITLVEGSLAVSDGERELTLQPCQQVVFNRRERTLSRHDLDNVSGYCAWINGAFDFKLQPLETILDAVSKWYDIEIVYSPAVVRRFDAITLQCDRRSDFAHIMQILQKVTGLHYRTEGKTVYITF